MLGRRLSGKSGLPVGADPEFARGRSGQDPPRMPWQRRAEQPQKRPVLMAFGLMMWPIFPMTAGMHGRMKAKLCGAGAGGFLVLAV